MAMKAPQVKVEEALAMLKLQKNKDTSDYARKMAALFTLINATSAARTGAEIVATDLTISQSGNIVSDKDLRSKYLHSIQYEREEQSNELKEVRRKIYRVNSEINEHRTTIRRKNTDKKKENAAARIEELEKELIDLNLQKCKIMDDIKRELENTHVTTQEMRAHFHYFKGVKIKVSFTKGDYIFPLPTGVPIYNAICSEIGLSVDTKEVKEKPVITKMFTMPSDVLVAMRTAARFSSTDDLRPSMTTVCLEIKNNKLIVVATDAHRLFLSKTFKINGPEGKYTYLIPAKDVLKLNAKHKGDFFFYEMKDGTVSILNRVITPLDAKFPDWRVVMPKYENHMTFERQRMIEVVKAVSTYSNKSTNQVTLHINGEIEVDACDVDFSFEGKSQLKYIEKKIPDTDIAFNAKFLIEGLSIFKDDKIKMYTDGVSSRAAIFTNDVDTVLIMPLMI